jgi:citrate synthase
VDADQKIARPRQVYLGERTRAYLPMEKRDGKSGVAKA